MIFYEHQVKKLKLKICGMKQPENIREVAALRPDYMGFIFYEKSPRFVGADFQVPALDPAIKRVAVFVDETQETMMTQSGSIGARTLQLHGNEAPEVCGSLRAKGYEVIKAFSVDETFDFHTLEAYEGAVDYFLFDTKGKLPGGNARAFDWSLLKQYHQRVPFFLSGGLNNENIHQLTFLSAMNLHALDVNSGVETSPGLKSRASVETMKQWVTTYNSKLN